jgi:hypothetical protein
MTARTYSRQVRLRRRALAMDSAEHLTKAYDSLYKAMDELAEARDEGRDPDRDVVNKHFGAAQDAWSEHCGAQDEAEELPPGDEGEEEREGQDEDTDRETAWQRQSNGSGTANAEIGAVPAKNPVGLDRRRATRAHDVAMDAKFRRINQSRALHGLAPLSARQRRQLAQDGNPSGCDIKKAFPNAARIGR